MLYSWQSGLGLPEREYYFLKDAKSAAIRAKYVAHVAHMLSMGRYSGRQSQSGTDHGAGNFTCLKTHEKGRNQEHGRTVKQIRG